MQKASRLKRVKRLVNGKKCQILSGVYRLLFFLDKCANPLPGGAKRTPSLFPTSKKKNKKISDSAPYVSHISFINFTHPD